MSTLQHVRSTIRIESIELLWVDDDDSKAVQTLGEYSNEEGSGRIEEIIGRIDRREQPGYQEHEFRFWTPVNFDSRHPENALQDYQRHEALCRGEWCYQGCVARAVVSYATSYGSRRLEHFSSAGIYGIESDSSPLVMMQAEVEQLLDLKAHLTVFGVPWSLSDENILQAAMAKLQDAKTAAQA